MVKPNSKRNKSIFSLRVRQFLSRWHRRAGLAFLMVFLMVAVTGVMLNHTQWFGLGSQYIQNPLLLKHYGYREPQIQSFQVDDHWFSHAGGDFLYRDAEQLVYCPLSLAGAVNFNDSMVVVACRKQILLIDGDGAVLEKLGEAYGVPSSIDKIGYCGEELCLESNGQTHFVDLDQLQWQAFTPVDKPEWMRPKPLPAELHQQLKKEVAGDGPSLERFVLDLHSGRLFGAIGVWIVDLAALGLVFLSLSGFYFWYRQFSLRKK
jgi:hypothetical protein